MVTMSRVSFYRLGCALVVALSFGSGPVLSDAGDGDVPYELQIVNLDLSTVLGVVSQDLGIDFSITGASRRRLRDVSISGSAEDVVDQIVRQVGMDAFEFNGEVHVSPIADRAVRIVKLGDIPAPMAKAALFEAGLLLNKFEISEIANGSALVLSGPVKYLALSEGVIASLEAPERIAAPTVRVRRAGRIDTGEASVDPVGTVAE